MSTKSSIFYDDKNNIHFYREALVQNYVYLSVNETTVAIPTYFWELMRQYEAEKFERKDATDEFLEEKVYSYIEERKERHEKSPYSPINKLEGLLYAGSSTEPIEHQAKMGIGAEHAERERQQEVWKEYQRVKNIPSNRIREE